MILIEICKRRDGTLYFGVSGMKNAKIHAKIQEKEILDILKICR